MKSKIALFGTSADPPTSGHKKIIEELSKVYKTVISYASDNPYKNHSANLYFRSLLLKTLIDDLSIPNIIFDHDISSKWAINSIQKCKTKNRSKSIDFVIGSDLINEIFSWEKINEIIEEVNLFIIPREGFPIESNNLNLFKENQFSFEIASFNIPKISSSVVRKNNKYSNLPQSLIPIIKANKLYINSK